MDNAGIAPELLVFRFPEMGGSGPQRDDYLLARAAFFKDTASQAVNIGHHLGAGPLGHLRLETLQALRAMHLMSDPSSRPFRGLVAALRAGRVERSPDTPGPVSLRNEREALRFLLRLLYRGDEAALIARDRELLPAPRSPPLAADVRLAIEVRLSARVGNQHVPQRALEAWRPLLELDEAGFAALLRPPVTFDH